MKAVLRDKFIALGAYIKKKDVCVSVGDFITVI